MIEMRSTPWRRLSAAAIFAGALLLSGCDAFYGGDTRHPLYRKAEKQRAAGEYDSAVQSLRKFLHVREDSARGHLALAAVYDENLGDMVGAIYHYREFLRLAPEAAEAPDVKSWIVACESRLQESLRSDAATVRLQVENRRLKTALAQYQSRLIQLNDELSKARISAVAAVPVPAKKEAEKKDPVPETVATLPPPAKPKPAPAAEPAQADPIRMMFASFSGAPAVPESPGGEIAAMAPEAVVDPGPVSDDAASGDDWPKTYVVQAGDSLSAISRRFYGSVRFYTYIMEANNIKSTRNLLAGQTLTLPPPPAKKEAK